MSQIRNLIVFDDLPAAVPGIYDGSSAFGSLPAFLTDYNQAWGLKSTGGTSTPKTVAVMKSSATSGSWSDGWIDLGANSSSSSFTNVEAECTITWGGASDDVAVLARVQGTAKTAFFARIFPGPFLNIGHFLTGTLNSATFSAVPSGAMTVGAKYRLRVRAMTSGGNTTITGWLATDAAPFTILHTVTSTIATPVGLTAAGHTGFARQLFNGSLSRFKWQDFTSPTAYESGWLSTESMSVGAVKLECTTPSQASGTVTYSWYRGAPGFTPGAPTLLGTSTNGQYTDTTASVGRWAYKCIQANVSGTATSNEALAYVEPKPIGILICADSRWIESEFQASRTTWPGHTAGDQLRIFATSMLRRKVYIYNAAVSGVSADGFNTTYLAAAITAANSYFSGLGIESDAKYAIVQLGVNFTPAAATLGSQLGTTTSTLSAGGYKSFLCYPTPMTDEAATHPGVNEALLDVQPYIDALVNGVTVFAGSKIIIDPLLGYSGMRADLLHEYGFGKLCLAASTARAIADAIAPTDVVLDKLSTILAKFPDNFEVLGINNVGVIAGVTEVGHVIQVDGVGPGAIEAGSFDASALAAIGDSGDSASDIAAALAGEVNPIIYSPATASTLDVFRGDSYATANGRAITITKVATETHWPTTLSTVHLTAKPTANTLLDYSSAASLTNILCTIVQATDSGSNLQSFTLELTDTELATLTAKDLIAGYRFWIVANESSAPATLRTGNMTVRKDASEA